MQRRRRQSWWISNARERWSGLVTWQDAGWLTAFSSVQAIKITLSSLYSGSTPWESAPLYWFVRSWSQPSWYSVRPHDVQCHIGFFFFLHNSSINRNSYRVTFRTRYDPIFRMSLPQWKQIRKKPRSLYCASTSWPTLIYTLLLIGFLSCFSSSSDKR